MLSETRLAQQPGEISSVGRTFCVASERTIVMVQYRSKSDEIDLIAVSSQRDSE